MGQSPKPCLTTRTCMAVCVGQFTAIRCKDAIGKRSFSLRSYVGAVMHPTSGKGVLSEVRGHSGAALISICCKSNMCHRPESAEPEFP